MISCTEFIPSYSELFKYIDDHYGYSAVQSFWTYLFKPDGKGIPLINFIKKDGLKGAFDYWAGTLKEESADVTRIMNLKQGWIKGTMHYCPSKGRLLQLQEELGIEPYEHYCEHCKIIYSRVLEKYGAVYERDHSLVHEAKCSSVLYEAGNPPPADYKEPKEGRTVGGCKREGKKYLHRDFHLLGDNALKYCADKYGEEAVVNFLKQFAVDYYAPRIAEMKEGGLPAVKAWLEKIYEIEEASEVLHAELDGDVLTFTVDKCPVIEYARGLNQELSPYYIEQTRTLYAAIAEAAGFRFELEYYNSDGAAKFKFFK